MSKVAIVAGAALALVLAGEMIGARAAGGVEGVWLTQAGDTHVKIAPCGTALCGDIVWVKGTILDEYNPDETKRDKSILGTRVLIDMRPSGTPGVFDGTAYNTSDGKVYTGSIRADGPDALVLKGCVMRVLCKSQVWTRAN